MILILNKPNKCIISSNFDVIFIIFIFFLYFFYSNAMHYFAAGRKWMNETGRANNWIDFVRNASFNSSASYHTVCLIALYAFKESFVYDVEDTQKYTHNVSLCAYSLYMKCMALLMICVFLSHGWNLLPSQQILVQHATVGVVVVPK